MVFFVKDQNNLKRNKTHSPIVVLGFVSDVGQRFVACCDYIAKNLKNEKFGLSIRRSFIHNNLTFFLPHGKIPVGIIFVF